MDKFQGLHPPAPSSGGAAAADEEAARRLHRALNARPARRGRTRLRDDEAAAVDEGDGEEEEEEVKISLLAVKKEEPEEEDVKIRTLEGVGAGGKRRRVKRERETDGAAEAGPSGRGAKARGPWNAGRGTSRFRGVGKDKTAKAKPWTAQIRVTEDGKGRQIYIGNFSREEDAARAFDRVNIAKLGHAKAKTNFPAVEYRAEWAELEALGVEGAVALIKEHVAAERAEAMNKTSRFRGVFKFKGRKTKPWAADIGVTEDGEQRRIFIGTFAREEDAARAYDRASIAKLGHAKAKTNFPVAEYRAEWGQLEALGEDGAAALMREHAAAERPEAMNKTSRFRGVFKFKGGKTKPWQAQIQVTEDGKPRRITIAYTAQEEDAARSYDRASIAKLGHAKAKTNFPVAEYRAEWAELEALGVDGAVALMKRHAEAERLDTMASKFRGVSKMKRLKAKPWVAKIQVTEDGKQRQIYIGTFAQEEDAARAYDRVSIAKLGHAEAKTNFPVAEYRAEWAQLEALGVEGAVALMKEHAEAERQDVMNKASRFRGVTKFKGRRGRPWTAKIGVTADGKHRSITIGYFAREEDAARAVDRASIAKLGHAEAKTNYPVAEYRAEWAELEALGVDGTAALMKEHAEAERQDVMNNTSRFWGVSKDKNAKAKPWASQIRVTKDGKQRSMVIAAFAKEEDAARAYDRVSIAKVGHAKARTNFPAAEYRAEWAELEALGVDGVVALMKEQAAAERQDAQSSRFRGVSTFKGRKTKPWAAQIKVTEDGKQRSIQIAYFAREEDAARAVDRVSIAKLGHAEAKTNYPAAEYRAEWAELEALGVDGVVALMRDRAAAERSDLVNKASRFRGVYNFKQKAKPWVARITVTEDGKSRFIHIGTFAREEDAARAYDHVSIAKLGHAKAKTNFPAAEYRAEWAELEALGVDGAVAREKRRARGQL